MSLRDAKTALREADAAFAAKPLPMGRLRERVLAEPRPVRWPWLLVPVAAALLAFVLWPVSVETVRLEATQRYAHGRFDLTANAASVIYRDHEALTLQRGDVEVSVAKQPGRVRIAVSHGVIEVVGTRFTIHQRDDGGDVTLHEGVIHFISADGTKVMAPGETVAWPAKKEEEPVVPVPPAPAPPIKKPRPQLIKKEPAVIHETDAAWLLEEVDTARSRGEYAEAVRLLDKGLAGIVSATTRERFSFELGSILTHQQADTSRACQHWRAHQVAFPAGRYTREVQSAMERSKCE